MSVHSYTRYWIHFIWSTHNRERVLLKPASSHWINKERVTKTKFSWGRGYGAFSVSQSTVKVVAEYIVGQEEHHRKKTFLEEYKDFITNYGLVWREEQEKINR